MNPKFHYFFSLSIYLLILLFLTPVLVGSKITPHPYDNCHVFVGIIADPTRFGDRLLDTWAMRTLMSYGNKSAVCHIFWQPTHKLITNESFSVGPCKIQELNRIYNVKGESVSSFIYSDYQFQNVSTTCVIDFTTMMNTGAGNNDPLTLFKNPNSKPYIPIHKTKFDVVNDYKQIAS